MSNLEDLLVYQIRLAGLPEPSREVRAIPGRKFRFDLAWTELGLLAEVQGGTWVKGGHSTGRGIERDTEKLNLALLNGYRVMQFTGDQIKSGKAIQWLQAFFREAA